jgi:phosphoserine phosphatase RsbX
MAMLVGAAQRAKPGELVCGDVSTTVQLAQGLLLCLADGLGHGENAQVCADAACGFVRAHADEPLEALMRGLDRALVGQRGAAVSLLSLEPAQGRIRFVGIGNVELRAIARAHVAPPTMSGIVGRGIRNVRVWEYPLAEGDLLMLSSDGISTRFELAALAHLAPQAMADEIVARHSKNHDDASCLVVRVGGPS